MSNIFYLFTNLLFNNFFLELLFDESTTNSLPFESNQNIFLPDSFIESLISSYFIIMIKKLYNNKIYNNKIYYKIMDQISDKFFYLPCEITHYTFRKYFSIVRDRFPGVKQVIDLIGPPDESKLGGIGYYQDAYVQLFNGTEYKNLINLNTLFEIFFLKSNINYLRIH